MNQGVEILLARMDSHPEEFDDYGPWHWLIVCILDEMHLRTTGGTSAVYPRTRFLTDKELKALADKLASLQGDAFTRRVMDQLLNPPERGADTMIDTTNIAGGFGRIVSGQLGINPVSFKKLTK